MSDVLLISNDSALIAEVQKICAVTQASVTFQTELSEADLLDTHTVLIDAQIELAIKHPNVVLVTFGQPGVSIWQKALANGAKYVAFLPEARPWLLENLLPKPNKSGQAIGVIGSTGGLGTSVLASSIAANLATDSHPVLLAEFTNHSGGLDVLWGIEATTGPRWSHLENEVLPTDLIRSLPKSNGVSILSSDQNVLPAKQLMSQITKKLITESQFTVLDLPSTDNQIFAELAGMCHQMVLVVGSTIRSINAANQLIKNHPEIANAKLAIRNLPGTNLAPLNIARNLDLELLGEIPTDVKIVEHLEQGLSPSKISINNYRKAISEIMAQLDITNVKAAA